MLECVVNVSEGRDREVVEAVAAAAGDCLLDVHTDADHHRTVLTVAGDRDRLEAAVRAVAREGVRRIDLGNHTGAHPRLGAVDVVPFAPLEADSLASALAARDRFAVWAGATLGVPCFRYGPERSLPDVRRHAFRTLKPDTGPPGSHPTAGAICVGARPLLVAYNVWLSPATPLEVARRVAAEVRGPAVRALGLDVGGRAQVSFNLIDPTAVGPAHAYDAVAARAPVDRPELVGLVPARVLESIPSGRWEALDLSLEKTIEYRLGAASAPVRPTPRSPGGGPASAGDGGGAVPAR